MNMHSAPLSGAPIPTLVILGIPVARIAWADAIQHLRGLLREKRYTKIGFLNAHNANVACSDPTFARALQGFLVLPDGVGVDIAAKFLYGEPFPSNLNGTDFVPHLIASATEPLKVALLGTTRKNAEGALAALAALAPIHSYELIHDGFFSPAEEPEVLDRIRGMRPDILLVAMGVPRQELWIERNLGPAYCTLPIAVGALLDFLSGAVPRAPVWVRHLRLEWLFRLVVEPGRLWRRYVVGNPLFLVRVFFQRLRAGRAGT
ncbi:MAG: WecB/TagA/CpsF family glycosyltransferase [Rhizobiaceae bacterium]